MHCRTQAKAQGVRAAITARMRECGLELHPEKTKVVYCKGDDRRGTYPNEKFDFLGYTFRPRRSENRKGKYFIDFSPAVSEKAVKKIRAEIRSWNLHLRSDKMIEHLSWMFNPIVRGWLQARAYLETRSEGSAAYLVSNAWTAKPARPTHLRV